MMKQTLFVLIGLIAVLALPLQARVARKVRSDDAAERERIRSSVDTDRRRYLSCSYAGDPHLLPFAEPYNQYWCHHSGWELLLSNKYVTIYVLVDAANNNPIIDYKLVFADALCSQGGPSNPAPCSPGSIVATSPSSSTYTHFHSGGEFVIRIVHGPPYYHFYIWQTPGLVRESCGVCVRWDCPPESLWMEPNPAVPQICDIFAAAGGANAFTEVNPEIIKIATLACINDVQTTFDVEQARQALTLVLQDGIGDLTGDVEANQAVFEKLEVAKEEATKTAVERANAVLKEAGEVCDENKRCLAFFGSEKIEKK